jgi:hypothetical protein
MSLKKLFLIKEATDPLDPFGYFEHAKFTQWLKMACKYVDDKHGLDPSEQWSGHEDDMAKKMTSLFEMLDSNAGVEHPADVVDRWWNEVMLNAENNELPFQPGQDDALLDKLIDTLIPDAEVQY